MRGDPDGDGDEAVGVSSEGVRLGATPAGRGTEGASGPVGNVGFEGAQGTFDQTLDHTLDELPEVASSGGVTLPPDHPVPHSDGVPVEARAEVASHLPKNDVADGVPVASGHDESSIAPRRESERLSELSQASSLGRPSDEELLDAWRAGDVASGERLWRRHAAAVQRFYRNKVPCAVANDLTQRSVEACLRARDRITSFRAYLLGVAARQLFEYIRSERRKRQRDADLETLAIDEAMPSPEEWVGTKREKRILLRALRRIPVIYQVVLELYYWEQLTQNEIAQVLVWPPGTVRTRIGKARRLVRAQLESLCRSHEERLSTIDTFEQWAARTHHAIPAYAAQGQSGPIDRDEVPPDDDLLGDDEPDAPSEGRMARGSMQFSAVSEASVDEALADGPQRRGGGSGDGDGGEGESGAGARRSPRPR